jgi:Uncharacterized protein encoded in toxicity protection region of plasmid R478, contains von Willebrand factor (vWF) domain
MEDKRTTPQTTTNKIYNLIILDESGSMMRVRTAAMDGANETINSIKGAQTKYPDQTQYLTFVTFDEGSKSQNVRFVIDTRNITEVDNITEKDYRPDGCTPLYDAIGISLTKLEQQVTEDDNVLVTIITDGLENASKEYKGPQIKLMIDRLKAKGWTFVFMGANMDSGEVARTLSIDNSMDFEADEVSYRCMSQRVNDSRQMYYEKVRMSKMSGQKCFSDMDFFNEKTDDRITPETITRLAQNEVFVFGSNIFGNHDGGAAGQAATCFGAVQGRANGPQGQSYAIATDGATLDAIKIQVDQFLDFASRHRHHRFLVTKIGCGNAGYTIELIAPLFAAARNIQNICLPEEFWRIIGR